MTAKDISSSYGSSILVRRWIGAWADFIALGLILLIADAMLGNELYQRTLPLWLGVVLAYFPLTEGLTGRSLGKVVSGTRVVDAAGNVPGVRKALIRTLLRLVEVNPVLVGGIPAGLAVLLSKTRQRLGDMASETYVLRDRDLPVLAPARVSKGRGLVG